jgi:hypothetical protein
MPNKRVMPVAPTPVAPIALGLIAMLALAGGGCATMFTGSTQQVTVSSQPPGARVMVNGAYSGVTPVALLLKTEHDYTLTLQREGYRDTTGAVFREFNPVAALNLVSLVCWAIDIATGAIWRLTPGAVYVTLQSVGVPGGYPPIPSAPPVDPWGPAPGIGPPGGLAPAPPPAYPPPPPGAAPSAPPASPGPAPGPAQQ